MTERLNELYNDLFNLSQVRQSYKCKKMKNAFNKRILETIRKIEKTFSNINRPAARYISVIIFLFIFSGCAGTRIIDAMHGTTISADKKKNFSNWWYVCIATDSAVHTIKWNAHCYTCIPTIPATWDVALLKKGKVIAKPVQ